MQTSKTIYNQIIIGQTHDLSDKMRYPYIHVYLSEPNCLNIYARSKIVEGDYIILNGERYVVTSIKDFHKAKRSISPPCVKGNMIYHETVKLKKI